MWYLSIIISIVIFVFLCFYTLKLYAKLKAKNIFPETEIHILNTFHPNIKTLPFFSNITSNLLLKEIIFIIFSLIIHFTDSLTPTYIYILLLLLAWFTYNGRKKEFVEAKQNYPNIIIVLRKAFIVLPIFNTILFLLCYLTFLLNE